MAMRTRFGLGLALLVMLVMLPAVPVFAQGPEGDVTIWNQDYLLAEGDALSGNLLVVNGNATLEADSRVAESVVVVNGNADVTGVVGQDLVVVNGSINLGESAWVQGSVVCTLNCELHREEGARVGGDIVDAIPSIPGFGLPEWHTVPEWRSLVPGAYGSDVWDSGPRWALRGMLRVGRAVLSVVVIAVLAGLLALIWPQQIGRTGQAVLDAPWESLGVGLLAGLIVLVVMVALVLTICLPPLVLLALVGAGLFGWAAIGALVGERLLKAFGARTVAPVWAAALGALCISIVAAGLDVIPCVGVVAAIAVGVLGCMGLGAVVLTRFGTRPYLRARPVGPAAPVAPAVSPAPVGPAEPEEPPVVLPDEPDDPDADI